MEAHVTCSKYRPSPIPSGGLEIPILLIVKKGDSTVEVFKKMENLIRNYYVEPDKIPIRKEKENEEIDLDVEFVPESELDETETAQERDDDAISQEVIVPETQIEIIPETQGIGNTQTIPETQMEDSNIVLKTIIGNFLNKDAPLVFKFDVFLLIFLTSTKTQRWLIV